MQRHVVSCLADGLLAALPLTPATATELPEGAGREQVEAVCTACHHTKQITRSSGYSAEGWRELTATMIDLSGDPALRETVTGYLAAHFPPSGRRAATLVPGDLAIAFTEWQVPTLGQRARDPVQAPDGTICGGPASGAT